ncbi:MAG: hypothetical protein WDM96_01000 [Lacunisphaera sp.]
MLTTAQLQRMPARVRPAGAWFLSGSEPAAWIEEIARWPVPTDQVRLYLLPASGARGVAGVLAVPAVPITLPAGTRGQPYGELAPGFFLPTDADLAPALEPAELKALCPYPVAVFHPAHGLVGFDQAGGRGPWEFLAPDFAAEEPWNLAIAAVPENQRLRSVRLVAPPALLDVFGPESDEIGREPFTQLPPAGDEVGDGKIARLKDGLTGALAKALVGLTALAPRKTNIAPTWINALEAWAQTHLSGLTAGLERRRHQELFRLLDLLKENPDEGLRHAISLAALANRGKAPPAAGLGRRPLDFDLSRIGGGRASDFWNVPAEIRGSLSTLYRENAQRELKLGRHRRAAYIYAELLGDLPGAADALKQGRFYREAALLYRERLRQPILAAECLAQGGLLDEAIEIYEEKGHWLEAAGLHERCGRPDAARAALRKVVAAHLENRDVLAAARLLEQRLGENEEALSLLTGAWPGGSQALMCLEERFALLTRLGRQGELPELLAGLGRQRLTHRQNTDLIGLLARVAENTAHAGVRRAASETVRGKAALVLTEGRVERDQEVGVLRALTRLVPQDRLLARDANRFRKNRPTVETLLPMPAVAPRLIPRVMLQPLRKIPIVAAGRWIRFASDAHEFQGVIRQPEGSLRYCRTSWRNIPNPQQAEWPDPAPHLEAFLLFSQESGRVFLGRPFAPSLKARVLSPVDARPAMVRIGTPDWLPEDTAQVAITQDATWLVRVVQGRVVLASYEADQQVYSRDVTDHIVQAGAELGGNGAWLDARGSHGRVALGYGNCLIVLTDGNEIVAHKLPGRVTGLLTGEPALPGSLVLLDHGAVFVRAATGQVITLDDTMAEPQAARLGDGRVVLLGGGVQGKVFQVRAGDMVPVAWFDLPAAVGNFIGLGPGDAADRLAVCGPDGAISLWQVPVRA